jgi:threonine/homoserine efflux transporter RhtA
MIIMIGVTSAMLSARIIILKILINYSVRQFVKTVMFPLFAVTILSAVIPVIIHNVLMQGILRLFAVVFLSILSISTAMFFIGLKRNEQEKIINIAHLFGKFLFNKNHKKGVMG